MSVDSKAQKEDDEAVEKINVPLGRKRRRLVGKQPDPKSENVSRTEESPKKSRGSNGMVERAAQAVEGQIRVRVDALEARLGVTVDVSPGVCGISNK